MHVNIGTFILTRQLFLKRFVAIKGRDDQFLSNGGVVKFTDGGKVSLLTFNMDKN